MRPVLLAHRPTRNRRESHPIDPMTGKLVRSGAAPAAASPEPTPAGSLDVFPTPDGDVAFIATAGDRRLAIVFDLPTAARIRRQIEACEAKARELAPRRIELGADPVVVEVPIPPEVREAIDELTHGHSDDPALAAAPEAS